MKPVRFDKEKDRLLRIKRKIGFLEIIDAIESDKVLKSVSNPNKKKFPNQKMMLISIKRYVYVVPYVENENEVFLKTIYPSRKYTKKLKVKQQI